MTVVVTGAAGHVGAALVRALLAEGRQVRALIRSDARALAGLDVERIQVDVTDRERLAAALAGASAVYHAAAQISLRSKDDPRAFEVNVGGTRALVDACLRAGVGRLVHVSSLNALDLRAPGAIDERRPLADRPGARPYDRSKAQAELEVLRGIEAGLDAVIVSPAAVIGPYDFKPSRMGKLFLDLGRGTLPALSGGGQTWVDVRDIAAGALAAEARGRRGERYLLGGHYRPVTELAAMAAATIGVRRPRIVLPLGLLAVGAPLAEGLSRLVGREPIFSPVAVDALRPATISHAKASDELGYTPRPLEATIAETMAWLREHHAIARN